MEWIRPGIYKDKDRYIKIFSELYFGRYNMSLSFTDWSAAERTAQKYQNLVDAEFYVPGSIFRADYDKKGSITVISEMPELYPMPGDKGKLQKIAADTLGVKVDDLWFDIWFDCNYGGLDDRYYYLDAHVLEFPRLLGDDMKYRKMPFFKKLLMVAGFAPRHR